MTGGGKVYRHVDREALKDVGAAIARQMEHVPVWLFYGEMGAGKTTLIKEVCRALGVEDAMSSPSFSIVNEYAAGIGVEKVFHFDFYRIRNEAEAFDIGAEEYFYSGYPCLVEWPEKIPGLIPPKAASVTLSIDNETQRTIAISIHDREEENGL
ncbi:tRNA (adenosine(37)-N6)-threonylcarbamoyltransferase complex ATPase subunit type 1 TsaE [Fulvivirgaceae bacterium PWU37]|uniref:tRNA threonylcarbamoyladenosine biosynthesis protein TsaE n=1 Tax=Dawidia soli TaxID=2782352 RepID=A0AAP2D5V8_9BACT|nr:tRNA (adenosine(37)-N6)-threonylcarbamoyltransferase complex ATPase subunit type 1 TsaE [Dawidia soli]